MAASAGHPENEKGDQTGLPSPLYSITLLYDNKYTGSGFLPTLCLQSVVVIGKMAGRKVAASVPMYFYL